MTDTGTHPTVAAWRAWVDAPGGQPAWRRLVVQIINQLRLAGRWEAFDRAVENFKFMGVGPDAAPESIREAVAIGRAGGWEPARVRAALR